MYLAVFVVSLVLFSAFGQSKCDANMEQVKAIRSRYSQVSNGDSTYYGDYPVNVGACELDPLSPVNSQPGWIKVAAGKDDYQKSLGCGMCVEIKGDGTSSTGGDTGNDIPIKGPFKATVVDLCGGCNQGGFDLFITGHGKWKTSFKAIECPSVSGQDGNIKFRFDGSNPWYLKVQVRNSKVVTVGLELLKDNKWHCMSHSDSHFTISPGEIKFPIKVRVTSVFNEQLEATITSLENEVDIPSKIQYKRVKEEGKPEDIKCYGQGGVTQEANSNTVSPPATTPVPNQGPSTKSPTTSKPGQVSPPATTPAPNQGPSTKSPTTSKPGQVSPPATTPAPNQGPSTKSSTTSKPGQVSPPTTTPPPNQGPSTKSPTTSKPGKGGSSQPSPTNAQKPTVQPSEQKDFCKERANGQYPDESDCKGFIVCSNGTPFKKQCPAGLMYNRDLKVCDWPRNVTCKEIVI